MATITTHNGSTFNQGHNRRDIKYTSKDGHIRENGHIEIWKDEPLREAYKRIFSDAQKEYNERQKRSDRKINDYYQKVKNDAKRHVCYEMIIGVYKAPQVSEKDKREIMKKFVDSWQARNPNLELVGAYYHADEVGEPHVHIDYIPVADCTRGMSKQNALNSAFEQMGYHGTSIKNTPQMAWQRAQNQELERLCKERGIAIEHDTEKKKHLSVREYQEMKEHSDKQKKKLDKALKKDLPSKKGLIFKRYSKDDLETLENKAIGIKELEKQIGMSVSNIPKYLKEKDIDLREAWGEARSAQNKADLLQMRLDEAQKEIKSLQAKYERVKQSNRDLLNELHPGEEKKRNREERHHTERNHDDFDLER